MVHTKSRVIALYDSSCLERWGLPNHYPPPLFALHSCYRASTHLRRVSWRALYAPHGREAAEPCEQIALMLRSCPCFRILLHPRQCPLHPNLVRNANGRRVSNQNLTMQPHGKRSGSERDFRQQRLQTLRFGTTYRRSG